MRDVTAFGVPASKAVALGEHYIGDVAFAITDVSARAVDRHCTLRSLGFVPDEATAPLFTRPCAGGVRNGPLPRGFEIRPLAPGEGPARAAAAWRAFATRMDPVLHTDRYLRFMASPEYRFERDLVAVAPDGRIAAYTIYWPDEAISLGLFEPVGTDPDFQRRGLARALIAHALDRFDDLGIGTARVQTNGANERAIACYLACGFVEVDRLVWWRRARQP